MTGCGGECCGITHKQRWLWGDNPKFKHRVDFAAQVLRLALHQLPDQFTRHDLYRVMHAEINADLKSRHIDWRELHKHCPTCKWDGYITDYLHTNGFLALDKLHPGARSGRYLITELGREYIAMKEAAAA